MNKAGKNLSDFTKAHDPTHKIESVSAIFERPIVKSTKRFIITAAQNATPVDPSGGAS